MKLKFIFVLGLFLAMVSCRSAQQLIDRAVKKDPTIVLGKVDTLTLSHFIIDSIQVVKNDTIVWERVSVEVKYDTIILNNQIYIERKKTRQEVRKEYKLSNKVARYEAQITKLQKRLDAKTDRVVVRHETKKVRAKSRWWLWFTLGGSVLVGGIIYKKLFKI